MTVREVTGDLFDPAWEFEAIGHGVNCKGMMGSGIAVPFKEKYPSMYNQYNGLCRQGILLPGQVMPWVTDDLTIFNIASQYHPGPSAKIQYLAQGLSYVRFYMLEQGIERLGLPRIGAGIGGLDYKDVYDTVDDIFGGSLALNVTIVSL